MILCKNGIQSFEKDELISMMRKDTHDNKYKFAEQEKLVKKTSTFIRKIAKRSKKKKLTL